VLGTEEVVLSYKSLSNVERVFRGFNTDLDIRPIRHRTETRVRVHVFLRMLSYYVSFAMAHTLAPMLFKDDDPSGNVSTKNARRAFEFSGQNANFRPFKDPLSSPLQLVG